MQDFWNQIILSNPLKKYLLIAFVILLSIIFKRIISRFIGGLLFRIVKKITYGVDKDSFVNLVIAPLETFLIVLVTIVSIEKLHFPAELNFDVYEISSQKIARAIAVTIFIMTFFW